MPPIFNRNMAWLPGFASARGQDQHPEGIEQIAQAQAEQRQWHSQRQTQ
jgi:hypothetical protein